MLLYWITLLCQVFIQMNKVFHTVQSKKFTVKYSSLFLLVHPLGPYLEFAVTLADMKGTWDIAVPDQADSNNLF